MTPRNNEKLNVKSQFHSIMITLTDGLFLTGFIQTLIWLAHIWHDLFLTLHYVFDHVAGMYVACVYHNKGIQATHALTVCYCLLLLSWWAWSRRCPGSEVSPLAHSCPPPLDLPPDGRTAVASAPSPTPLVSHMALKCSMSAHTITGQWSKSSKSFSSPFLLRNIHIFRILGIFSHLSK